MLPILLAGIYLETNIGKARETRSLLELVPEKILMSHEETDNVLVLSVREYAYEDRGMLTILRENDASRRNEGAASSLARYIASRALKEYGCGAIVSG